MRYRRILSIILIFGFLFLFAVPAYAVAATTSQKAEILKALTVFSSSSLDIQVKRYEAAVYAVRILGKEAYIKEHADTYMQTRFSDVKSSQAYAPYIGYCDELGLIKDAQNGKFLPDRYITEKAFLNIILGAMGYIYRTDYTITNIYAKAYEYGLYTDASYKTKTADNTGFKKSDAVNILFNALSKPKKGTKIKMIQNLVSEKVVSKETAISTGLLTDSVSTAIERVIALDQNNVFIKINESILNLTTDNIKIFKTGSKDKTLSFTIKSQGADGSLVLSTDGQEALESYTIELLNIKDAEGNEADLLTGSFEGVQGAEIKSDFFKISRVIPISKDCINVYFTHPVNINSLIPSSYEMWNGENLFLKGSSQTLSVQALAGVDNGVALYFKNTTLAKDALYILKIDGNLASAYGVKMNDGNGDSIKFKGIDTAGSSNTVNTVNELFLSNISLIDNQTMRLEFNTEITPTRAKLASNYYITDAAGTYIPVRKAVLTSEGGKSNRIVLVSINGTFAQAASYSLAINYMTDSTRQYAIDGKQYSFIATFPTKVNLVVNSVNGIDGGTLKINFNKALDRESAENAANYLISGVSHIGYNVNPVKAIYDPSKDPYSVMLYLPSENPILKDKVYLVSAMGTLKDDLGNLLSAKINFVLTCSNGTVTKPSIKEAVMISSDSIRVDFNKEILLEWPAILTSNYVLQYIDGGEAISRAPLGICIISKTRIILKFDKLNQNIVYNLSFGALKDYSNNSNGTDFGGQGIINVAPGK